MVKLEDKVKELEDRIKSLEDRMKHGWIRHEYIPPNPMMPTPVWPWPQPSYPPSEPYVVSSSGEITYGNNKPMYQVSQWVETDKPVG